MNTFSMCSRWLNIHGKILINVRNITNSSTTERNSIKEGKSWFQYIVWRFIKCIRQIPYKQDYTIRPILTERNLNIIAEARWDLVQNYLGHPSVVFYDRIYVRSDCFLSDDGGTFIDSVYVVCLGCWNLGFTCWEESKSLLDFCYLGKVRHSIYSK